MFRNLDSAVYLRRGEDHARNVARVQAYFLLRGALRPVKSPRSPETDAQEAQVRAWFAEWRPRRIEVAASGGSAA